MAVASAHRRYALLGVLVMTLSLLLVPAEPAEAIDGARKTTIRNRLERRINNTRERRGLDPLTVNVVGLQENSQDHARFMARKGYLVHDSLTSLLREAPLGATWYSENVGRTTRANAARALHRMFMKSSGHRKNILEPDATHMGIGVVKRNGYVWVVERFAEIPTVTLPGL